MVCPSPCSFYSNADQTPPIVKPKRHLRRLFLCTWRESLGREGRANRAELDVGEDDGRVGNLSLELGGDAGVSGARATLVAGAGAVDGEG